MSVKLNLFIVIISAISSLISYLISKSMGVPLLFIPVFPIVYAALLKYKKSARFCCFISIFIVLFWHFKFASVLSFNYLTSITIAFIFAFLSTIVMQGVAQLQFRIEEKLSGDNLSLIKTTFLTLIINSLFYALLFNIILRVLGFDFVFANTYALRVFLSNFICFSLLLPVALIVLNYITVSNPSSKRTIYLLFTVVSIMCFYAFAITEKDMKKKQYDKLMQDVRALDFNVKNEVSVQFNHLESLKNFFNSSDYVGSFEFSEYSNAIIKKYSYMNYIFYAPLLSEQTKTKFISEFKKEFGKKLQSVIPNKIQDPLFLIKYVNSKEPMFQDKAGKTFPANINQDALSEVYLKGKTVLMNDGYLNNSIGIVGPVYRKNENKPSGIIVITLNLENLTQAVALRNTDYPLKQKITYSTDNFKTNFIFELGQKYKFYRKMQNSTSSHYLNLNYQINISKSFKYYFTEAKLQYWLILLIISLTSMVFVAVILALMIRENSINEYMKKIKNEIDLRAQAESELQKLNKNLEAKIATRTQEITERNLELEDIFKAFPDAFFVVDSKGKIVHFEYNKNPGFAVKAEPKMGMNFFDIIPESLIHLFDENFKKSFLGNKMQMFSTELEVNNSIKYYEVRMSPFSKNKLLIVIRDSTEIIELEKQVQEQNIIAIKHSKMASLGEMAGGIAHEINNPLTIIDGSAKLIDALLERETIEKDKIKQYVQRITQTVERIAKIVYGLRKFARDGSMDTFEETYVRSFVNDTLSLCQEKFKNYGVRLEVHCNTNTNVFWAKSVELSQVILNLLNNAFDAVMDQDDKWVRLNVQDDDKNLYFEVMDSGPGIPSEIRDKIMQPFFTTKKMGVGTGLGLSISRGIVEMHGGKLELIENVNRTLFRVTVPIIQNQKQNS